MQITIVLLSLAVSYQCLTAQAAGLPSSTSSHRQLYAKSDFDAIYSTLIEVFDNCDTTTDGKTTFVECTTKYYSADLSSKGKSPSELILCKVDKNGNKSKCTKYKFSKNIDLVLNRAFPGTQWNQVVKALYKKYGSKNCTMSKDSPVMVECTGKKEGELALLVAIKGKGSKYPQTPDALQVCDKKGCKDSQFNKDRPTYSIINSFL